MNFDYIYSYIVMSSISKSKRTKDLMIVLPQGKKVGAARCEISI
jgi:hypothetical protein